MLLKGKERVDLNNNGLSIESTARLFQDGKWVKRHILCKKPNDLNVPIFYVFKSKRDKQKNAPKLSLVMNNYIGFESGFEHKKRRNTLSLLTADVCVLLSFDLAENFIVWEAWLKNICGQTASFFMQLKKIPSNWKCTYALLKEVRCHVRESYLGIVYGRPQEVLLYIDLTREAVDISDNNLVTIHPSTSEESIILLCPKAPILKRFVAAARIEGGLPRLLNREQYEGDWIPRDEKKRSFGDQTSQLTVNISELASLMRTPEPTHNHRIQPGRLGKGLSKSGYVFEGSTSGYAHRPVSRSNSTAAYYSTAPHYQSNGGPILRNFESVNYVNIDTETNHYVNHSRRASATEHDVLSTKFSEPSIKSVEEAPIYCNIPFDEHVASPPLDYQEVVAVQPLRSNSLPEYVNIQMSGGVPQIIDDDDFAIIDYPQSSHMLSMSEKVRRRSDNSMIHNVYPSTSRGRSIPDFASAHYEEGHKHENWKRAKKFFSAFKPKSQSDLHHNNKKSKHRRNSIIKSSSTGALQFSSSVSYFPRGSTGSESDDGPPPLNVSICGHMTRSQPMLSMDQHPPAGLIQAPNEIHLLKKSRGVGAILARRKIRGSFTKYDGQNNTHMYKPQSTKEEVEEVAEPPPQEIKNPPPRPPKPEKFDGIASAVNRGQEKLKMCDRRASNVSFNKVNINADLPLDIAKQENKEGTTSRPLSRADSAGHRRAILTQLTNSRLSNSHSEYTRSSNESLSSDARSRISIRKKHNSPPKYIAPRLPPQLNTETYVTNVQVRLRPSSSVDSLNSEQTARSMTPPMMLPRRNPKDMSQHSLVSDISNRTTFANYCDLALPMKMNSSSSNNSVSSNHLPTEYVLIDPITTRAAQEAVSQQPFERSRVKSSSMTGVAITRRKSQGQGSSASDSLSVDVQPARQGFFKKYRKMRRARKNAASLDQLNL